MKTDKELADQERAREYLVKRGYQRKPCPNPNCIRDTIEMGACLTCDGKGYIWEGPLMSATNETF
jgi:hypothetical protein